MKTLIDVLIDVVGRLDTIGIPSMVSDSVATSFYIEPRFTNDVDIVVQFPRKSRDKVLSAFRGDYYITDVAIEDAFGGLGLFNVIHNESSIKCDIILLKEDEFSQQSFKRRTERELQGHTISVIALEDLILQKLLWRKETLSEQQWSDVERLVSVNRAVLDVAHLRSWAQRLSVVDDLEKLL